MSETSRYPPGWDEGRVRCLLDHYDRQNDEEALAEDEAALARNTHAAMTGPVELVPAVREFIAKHHRSA